MVGIYKITNPSGKVYIGQSWDIAKRWKNYSVSQTKGQHFINHSLAKYGREPHDFEVCLELPYDISQEVLDQMEQAYIFFYKEAGFKMMNMLLAGSGGKPTEVTMQKLRRPKSEEHRKSISDAVKKQWAEGKKKHYPLSEEAKNKISKTLMGHPINSGCFKNGHPQLSNGKNQYSK
jgi:group I intron endonuclease